MYLLFHVDVVESFRRGFPSIGFAISALRDILTVSDRELIAIDIVVEAIKSKGSRDCLWFDESIKAKLPSMEGLLETLKATAVS